MYCQVLFRSFVNFPNGQRTTVNGQPSTVNCQLSTVNRQPSTVNPSLPIASLTNASSEFFYRWRGLSHLFMNFIPLAIIAS